MVFSLKNWAGLMLGALVLAACGGGQQGDLDDASQLALEIAIVSTFASPNTMFTVALSDELRERHDGLEGVQLRNSAYGSNMPVEGGRVIRGGPGGRVLETDLRGSVNASIEVRDGEVGLVDGNIYVGEGTRLTNMEGKVFTFLDGQWSAKPQKPLSPDDAVAIVTITIAQERVEMLGLSDIETSGSFVTAMTLFDDFKRATHEDKDQALRDLIDQMIKAPITTTSDGAHVFLGDISNVEYRYAPKSASEQEDTLMVSTVAQ